MVSGFLTSPCDHSRIFSGLASEMRMAEKDSGSFGFSKKEKMSRIRGLLVFDYERKNSRKLGIFRDCWVALCRIASAERVDHQSSAAVAVSLADASISSTLRQSDCSSLIKTLKLSGNPASSAYSPLTMDSYMRVRPWTSSLFTVRNSCNA